MRNAQAGLLILVLAAGCASGDPSPPKPDGPAPAAPLASPTSPAGGDTATAPPTSAPEETHISLSIEDEEAWKVVQRIATLSGASVVCDPEHVQGRVTVHMVDVPWRKALESVAHAGGYIVAVDGTGVVHVLSLERSYNLKEPVERR